MKNSDLKIRRRQLDRQLQELTTLERHSQPSGGWIKSIRESLGMTLDSFGKRLGVTRATAHQIEKAEVNESITIKRLRAAADALECDLLIQIVPRQSLEELVSRRAYSLATAEVDRLNHSMLLEGQAIYDKDLDDFIAQVAESLIERKDARLWISE